MTEKRQCEKIDWPFYRREVHGIFWHNGMRLLRRVRR